MTTQETLVMERDLLRAALVGLVGVDTRAKLKLMEATIRQLPLPAQDKAITLDAVHALIATLADQQGAHGCQPVNPSGFESFTPSLPRPFGTRAS